MKKELKDEITHLLYDQTRRTPIVIPVINEIGGGGGNRTGGDKQSQAVNRQANFKRPATKKFPAPAAPDTEANDTKAREVRESRAY